MSFFSNAVKKRSTLQKLIVLHKEFDHDAEVLHCYKELVDSIASSGEEKEMATPHEDDSAAIDQAWIEATSYLLGRKELSDEAWALVSEISTLIVIPFNRMSTNLGFTYFTFFAQHVH